MGGLKGSLTETIVLSDDTQPPLYMSPKRRDASMQGGHHLHTCTTSLPRGFPNGKGSHISQYSGGNLLRIVMCVGASENL